MKNDKDYKGILDSISDGVFTVDGDWRITFFNKAASKITGVSKEEALGSYCSEVFRSSLCGDNCALKETIEKNKEIINKSCNFINTDGERVPVTLSTSVLKDENGNIIGGAETFRDMTEIEDLKVQIDSENLLSEFYSKSPKMQNIFHLIKTIAPTGSTCLIVGETGTGKEGIAKNIHKLSDRNSGPFIAINCAALPENLLESELFGHKKGSFTGAVADRKGLFERAEDGTLFLDEIGDISPGLQVRLLRVLQEKEFELVGGSETISSNARVIAATNKNLKLLIKEGKFREDLFYRLNVINIKIPPLRDRKEDLPILVDNFIKRNRAKYQKDIIGIDLDVMNLLHSYDWPGNIRELENVIERAYLLCSSNEISPLYLSEEIFGHSWDDYLGYNDYAYNDYENYNEAYDDSGEVQQIDNASNSDSKKLYDDRASAEKEIILDALYECSYNKQAAANKLGIHKTTLFKKLKKYGIPLNPDQ